MHYRPLRTAAEEIRVVCLHPPNNGETYLRDANLVHCSIEHRSLLGVPEYHALSYTWGDPKITRPIVVDGEEVQVTLNLEAAIRQLRDDGNFPILWVDALCINQDDEEEKGVQVRRMGFIYSRAVQVISWVGLEADGSSDVMSMMETVASKGYPPPEMEQADPQIFVKFVTFFQRPYFSRVWVRQEMSLAKEVIVYCGSRRIQWDLFVKSMTIVAKIRSSERMANRVVSSLILRHNQRKHPVTLLEALVWTREAEATNPRDKIYGLLGICDDGPDIFPVVDYGISLQDLFKQTSREILLRSHNLDILRWRSKYQTPQGSRPTWVSDWMNLKFIVNSVDLEHFDSLDISYEFLEKMSRVKKDLYKYLHPAIDFRGDILKVRGRVNDVIDGLTTAFLITEEDQEWVPAFAMVQSTAQTGHEDASKLAEQLMRCLIWSEEDDESDLTWFRNFSICFVFLMSQEGEVLMKEQAPELWKWFIDNSAFQVGGRTLGPFGSWHRSLKDTLVSSTLGSAKFGPWLYERALVAVVKLLAKSLKDMPVQDGGSDMYSDKGVPFLDIVRYIWRTLERGMRLATTVSGRFGMVHMQTRPGDKIVSINGCLQPLILRDTGNGAHYVIGGAFIRGGTKPKGGWNDNEEEDIFIV